VGGRLGKAPYFASTVLSGLEEATEKEFGWLSYALASVVATAKEEFVVTP
jgi:hypothetical protein